MFPNERTATIGEMAKLLADLVEKHGPDTPFVAHDPVVAMETGEPGDHWTSRLWLITGRQEDGSAVVLVFPHADMARITDENGQVKSLLEIDELQMA